MTKEFPVSLMFYYLSRIFTYFISELKSDFPIRESVAIMFGIKRKILSYLIPNLWEKQNLNTSVSCL